MSQRTLEFSSWAKQALKSYALHSPQITFLRHQALALHLLLCFGLTASYSCFLFTAHKEVKGRWYPFPFHELIFRTDDLSSQHRRLGGGLRAETVTEKGTRISRFAHGIC